MAPNRPILTTHTGSLPRPEELVDLLYDAEIGQVPADYEQRISQAVASIVRRQVDLGLDVVNDGEASKVSYSTYVAGRLAGFEEQQSTERRERPDVAAFPRYAARMQTANYATYRIRRFACTSPVSYTGGTALRRDIANLKAVASGSNASGVFMTAASPGVISNFQPNRFYPTTDAYLWAVADAMKVEYEAIHAAGFILQLDCPDLPALPLAELERRVEILNHATASIPPEAMRLHLCWGNYEGPHHLDRPLRDFAGAILKARPAGLSFEAANPRHEHEWKIWQDIPLPAGKYLIPGVIDSTTNYIEHPELVAERISRFVEVVGPDRVVAGTDCGFGTFAGPNFVDPDITFAKLASLVEGARLASV